MNDLELYQGMDFSKYQVGDVICIPSSTVLKMFRRFNSVREFVNRLVYISDKLGLVLKVVFDDDADEYQISMNWPEDVRAYTEALLKQRAINEQIKQSQYMDKQAVYNRERRAREAEE